MVDVAELARMHPDLDSDRRNALKMIADGADMLDLGAESTRPGSSPVASREQLRRLLPASKAIRRKAKTPISIDTASADVADACLKEGADTINDVSALRGDRRMAEVLRKSTCAIVLMHMRGTPRTMQRRPAYTDVMADIVKFLKERIEFCVKQGIAGKFIVSIRALVSAQDALTQPDDSAPAERASMFESSDTRRRLTERVSGKIIGRRNSRAARDRIGNGGRSRGAEWRVDSARARRCAACRRAKDIDETVSVSDAQILPNPDNSSASGSVYYLGRQNAACVRVEPPLQVLAGIV